MFGKVNSRQAPSHPGLRPLATAELSSRRRRACPTGPATADGAPAYGGPGPELNLNTDSSLHGENQPGEDQTLILIGGQSHGDSLNITAGRARPRLRSGARFPASHGHPMPARPGQAAAGAAAPTRRRRRGRVTPSRPSQCLRVAAGLCDSKSD